MLLQFNQVVEGIRAATFRRVDQAHEEVSDIRPLLRFVKERALPMQDRFFQRSFADGIVERGARHMEKQGEFRPMVSHIRDSLSKT